MVYHTDTQIILLASAHKIQAITIAQYNILGSGTYIIINMKSEKKGYKHGQQFVNNMKYLRWKGARECVSEMEREMKRKRGREIDIMNQQWMDGWSLIMTLWSSGIKIAVELMYVPNLQETQTITRSLHWADHNTGVEGASEIENIKNHATYIIILLWLDDPSSRGPGHV